MRYLSVCSGIEAASVAWHPLGWQPVAFSEIESFPCAVLKQRWPGVPNWGNMERWHDWPDAAVDLLVGGTPCQSFSLAGLRKGLADPRGNLALTYLAIADRYRPRWILWENVPGVLSSSGGRDFGALVGAMVELGYGAFWRVLDAQYCRVDGFERAVPQRRRRVFVVGYLGDWRRAAAVLLEPEGVPGNPPPRREAGKRSSHVAGGGPDGGSVTGTVSSKWAKGAGGPAGDEAYNLVVFTAKDYGADAGETSPTLRAGGYRDSHANGGVMPAVAFDAQQRDVVTVRRLTPRECERLQGFPDDYTAIRYRGKRASDGPRYRALGNSMAVNCMRWIGRRIGMVDSLAVELGLESGRAA